MRIGVVVLPEHPWSSARGIWQTVEELGAAHAWTYDHLAWRNLRDSTWFGTVPTLTAAALATTRIRLGTLVASPNFRHPVPFARDLIALDDISAGRLTLGIGAGGSGWDASILGQDPISPRQRGDRFDEFVTLIDRLLRGETVSFAGEHFAALDAPMVPGSAQSPRIPFAVAATGRRGMELTARFGQTWITNGERDPERTLDAETGARLVAEQSQRLDEACAAAGRDPDSIGRLVLLGLQLESGLGSAEQFRETIGRYAEVGVTDLVVHWPRDGEPYAGDRATFERVLAAVTS